MLCPVRPAVVLVLVLATLGVAGCGGGDEPPLVAPATDADTQPPPPSPGPMMTRQEDEAASDAPVPLPGLPDWTGGYTAWTRLNAEPLPPRESDPHLSTKNVYASQEIMGSLYPEGTGIVKEGVRPGTDFVGLIASMRKVAGANPEHNDWVFVEWTREAEDQPFKELASGAVCESCHSGVADQDYVFTRETG